MSQVRAPSKIGQECGLPTFSIWFLLIVKGYLQKANKNAANDTLVSHYSLRTYPSIFSTLGTSSTRFIPSITRLSSRISIINCYFINKLSFRRWLVIFSYGSIPGKHPCTAFQGATVPASSMQTDGILILGKHPCGSKSWTTFKRPWDTTIIFNHAVLSIAYHTYMYSNGIHNSIRHKKLAFYV